ncbi:unnamed protein product [Toxocara canis]|uniref:Protein kinase domain-containing protein n=1 Tax=Toxocara canis TaxID=6265 RepID=A0A183TWP2_TOXCA|nr:unnamed protein product [Toxocara canis]
MGERNVGSAESTVAVEEKRFRAWEATKRAFSGIASVINPHAKNEENGNGNFAQIGSSLSNPGQSVSLNVSKTGSTASISSSVTSQALLGKEKLIKIHTNQAACGRDLFDEPYYHGYMTGIEAEEMLGDVDGTFLVHKAAVRNKPNVADLIRYHNRKRFPVSKKGIVLYTWIQRQQWQLYYEQIQLLDKVGQDDFGESYRGKLARGVLNRDIPVTIKTFKAEKMDADSRIRFLRESNQMLGLKHKNVIRLYGVSIQKDPVMIVSEYAPGGSLLSRVRNLELALSLEDKVRYCRHIACGMEYLHYERVIHKGLSARNCLLGEHDTAKVMYLGFSLLISLQYDTRAHKSPMRWLAPETLQDGFYDCRTDVWSYGVLMWEVYSGGKHPYNEIKNNTLLRQKILMEGLRLTPPEGMPPEMIELMNQCFAKEEARPSFVEICNSLSKRSALFRHLRAHVSRNMAVLKSLLQKTSSTDNCVSVDIALPTAAGTNDA